MQSQVQGSPNPALTWFSFTQIKIVATSVSLFLRLILSFILAAYDGWVRRQGVVARRLKDRFLVPSVVLISSKLSFTAISEVVTYPSNKIDPIIQTFRVINFWPVIKWFPRKATPQEVYSEPEPEKSVNCEVLYDPQPTLPRADVIFIHGLHGSIVHTWKQGRWEYRKHVQNLPLKHKATDRGRAVRSLPSRETSREKRSGPCSVVTNVEGSEEGEASGERRLGTSAEDHDQVLENITDIINNIDDQIKKTTKGVREPSAEPWSPCWPRDWLPRDCPGIRIIAVNYTTDPFLWRPLWITKRIRTSLEERSREMTDHLLRIGVGQRPIVWVGHSKGGLFVKQMLVDASEADDPKFSRFLEQTKAIMFYSVPHRGSTLAHLNLPLLRQSIELTEVKKDCHKVLKLHKQFMKLYDEKCLSAEVFSFVETILTFMFITNVRVVSVDSADMGFGAFHGVNIDHREICKPLSRDCFLYKELANLINRVI